MNRLGWLRGDKSLANTTWGKFRKRYVMIKGRNEGWSPEDKNEIFKLCEDMLRYECPNWGEREIQRNVIEYPRMSFKFLIEKIEEGLDRRAYEKDKE